MNVKTLTTLSAALLIATAAASMNKAPANHNMPDTTMTGDAMMKKSYQVYTKAAFDAAKGQQRVLFFHATWCPNCKKADSDINAKLGLIPAGVTIFKTNYDKEVALKKQYGITSQHTFVLVDAGGKALKKWAGGGLKEILAATAAMKK